MDYFVKGALVVISTALIFISAQAYQINESLKNHPPTVGEFLAVRDITDQATKTQASDKLINRIPLVRVHSGNIHVTGGSLDVSGSDVRVHGTVSTY
jgi:hypothetical protein